MFFFMFILPLSLFSSRGDDEVNQVPRKFLQGLPATKETIDSTSSFKEGFCYACGIEVRYVIFYPFGCGIGIIEWEGLGRLNGDLEHKTNSKEMSSHSKTPKCLVSNENRTISASPETVSPLQTRSSSCSPSRDPIIQCHCKRPRG